MEEKVIQNFNTYFPMFANFDLKGTSYIVGGFLTSILLNEEIHDLDIVVLNGNKANIKENLDKGHLSYHQNYFHGYKVQIDFKTIDIYPTSDLKKCYQYNIEGLFYDISKKEFVETTFIEALTEGNLKELNPFNRGKNVNERKEKLESRLQKLSALKEENQLPNIKPFR